MAWMATTVFGSITSISEVVVTSLGAKGLCLHNGSGARSFRSKSVAVEERTKSAGDYASKNPDKLQAKNKRIYA
jgi:hypothetical protein